jgi:hypothetical protein
LTWGHFSPTKKPFVPFAASFSLSPSSKNLPLKNKKPLQCKKQQLSARANQYPPMNYAEWMVCVDGKYFSLGFIPILCTHYSKKFYILLQFFVFGNILQCL